jgi:hypothetical protein
VNRLRTRRAVTQWLAAALAFATLSVLAEASLHSHGLFRRCLSFDIPGAPCARATETAACAACAVAAHPCEAVRPPAGAGQPVMASASLTPPRTALLCGPQIASTPSRAPPAVAL